MEDLADLFDLLGFEDDECAVISCVVERESNRAWRVLRGSVIIGPQRLGDTNWTGWQAAHELERLGPTEPDSAAYFVTQDRFGVAREVTTPAEAARWLAALVGSGATAPLGGLPELNAGLGRPIAPLRLSNQLDTEASTFMSAAVRSATGFLFPGDAIHVDPPSVWRTNDLTLINPPLAAGLLTGPGGAGGVLLARLERRAWFTELRGGEDLETFDCTVGLDVDRIDVSDLVILFDEWIDGELVHSQQIALNNIEVDHVRGHPSIVVQLPTLGVGVERTARLHDTDGNFLDGSKERFIIAERISVTMRVVAHDQPLDSPAIHEQSFSVGHERITPQLVERAEAVDRVRAEYQELFTAGAQRSLVPPGTDLRQLMRDRLRHVRGTLRIVDRYFGKDPLDWLMVEDVSGPIEVLISLGKPPPPGGRQASIVVRRHSSSPPPFHGRAYLWEGGGLIVDASPNGFGHSLVFVTPMNPTVSAQYQNFFSSWWAAATPI